MQKGTAYIGLDVHKASIAAAIASDDGKPPTLLGTIANDPAAVRKLVTGVQHGFSEVRAAYEAGPTGYGLHRQLSAIGIECRVVAPAQIPRRANDRVKTDRRDALMLARLLRSGDLDPIWVPDESHEALRGLVRARADAHADLLRDRHRLNNFLMTRGLHGPVGARMSSARYDRWLETLHFERPAERIVFDDSRDVIRGGVQRERRIETALYECARDSRHAGLIRALQALRGVGELTAITIVTEVGDFRRFATAPHLMAYVGLVPSEHSSGASQRRGHITKAGNHALRHVLIESAHHARRTPQVSPLMQRRLADLPEPLVALSWRAQQRLHFRYRQLGARLGRPRAVVAVARELVGFIWAVGTMWEGLPAA
jgi:transposase